ncbi:MAG: sulfotransferase [Hahellaceae bacterium]|nr:sulfotransferase [Hahellaceae bacterium]
MSIPTTSIPTILYVMGTGRSGTTILEIVLKAADDVDGLGEMTHFPRDGVILNKECACGAEAHACEAWGPVVKEITRKTPNTLRNLNKRIDGHVHFPLRAFGHFGDLSSYKIVNQAMYTHVHFKEPVKYIVDSSKYASRPLALKQFYPGSIKVIAITRSPAELLNAFQEKNEDEQKPKSYLMAALYYFFVLLCMKITAVKFKGDTVSIRYEDLVTDPDGTLTRIEKALGLDLSRAKHLVNTNSPLSPGHIVTGNRLRKSASIIFRKRSSSLEENEHLPFFAQFLSKVMTHYRNLLGF